MTHGLPVAATLLKIGLDETEVRSPPGGGNDAVETLALGSRRTSTAYFRHDLPKMRSPRLKTN